MTEDKYYIRATQGARVGYYCADPQWDRFYSHPSRADVREYSCTAEANDALQSIIFGTKDGKHEICIGLQQWIERVNMETVVPAHLEIVEVVHIPAQRITLNL